MADKARSNLRCWLLTIITFLAIALIACAGPVEQQWHVGLDAIASNGRWATAVEHGGDPLSWRLALLDLQQSQATVLEKNIDPRHNSSFSPDSQHVLFRTSDGWALIRLSGGEPVEVATEDEGVLFLPDGQLLITSSADGLTSFLTVADPNHPKKRSLLLNRIRYSFRAQRPGPSIAQLDRLAPTPCTGQPISDRILWTAIDADDAVSVVEATSNGVSVRRLSAKLSSGVRTLLNQQASAIESLIAMQRQTIRERVEQEAAEAGEVLSEEQIEHRIEIRLQEWVPEAIGASLSGRLSADGTELFFLSFVPSQDLEALYWLVSAYKPDVSLLDGLYTLYLIDLSTGIEPQVLSSKTEWMPNFAFSPDGHQILFESNRGGGRSLYLANSDGTNIRLLPVQDVLNPCWY